VPCLYIGRDTTVKLGRKVEDLEDVRYLVNILNEVRGCIGWWYGIACLPACAEVKGCTIRQTMLTCCRHCVAEQPLLGVFV
jgi:hypothetical protein